MPQVSALDALLAKMTATILDTQAATNLQEMALASLPPQLLKLAESLGLFGLRVTQTQDTLDEAAGGRSGGRSNSQADIVATLRARIARLRNMEGADQSTLAAIRQLVGQVNVIIDGESVATATTRAQSEGVR